VYRRCKAAQEAWRISILCSVFFFLGFAITGCSSNSSVSGNQTAAPAFSPGGGSYKTVQSVKIASATSGAVLYCTTDGTTPKTSSPLCPATATVSQTEYLQAIAVAPGMAASAMMSAGYTINLNAVATPVFSPAGGNYSSTQTVTLSAATGDNIFYTLDDSTPTTASTPYTGSITVSASETVNAIAAASGYSNSDVATAAYIITPPLAPPMFNPASEPLLKSTPVSMNAASGATIYYTVDGSIPTLKSSVYNGPITVSGVTTINAFAVLGTQVSAMASAAYSFVGTGSVLSPTISPGSGGTIQATLGAITLDDTDANANIYYTIDGSSPINAAKTGQSTNATLYKGAFTIPYSYYLSPGHVLVQAFALDTIYGSPFVSQVSNTFYFLTSPPYPPPAFSIPTGSDPSAPAAWSIVPAGTTVTIANQDKFNPNSPIYYTTDGTTPTPQPNLLYTPGTPITLSNTGIQTLEAITADPDNKATPTPATAIYIVGAANTTALSGTVVSGVNDGASGVPITGASVQLYAAGIAGYGAGAYALGSPVTTDNKGSFTISSYVCPPAPMDQVYLVATGGTEGSNGANSSVALMTALGACGSLPANATINEVTTIASAYALAAFAQPNSSGGGIAIGAPGTGAQCTFADKWQSTGAETCNYNGLASAFKAVNNLVNVTGGSQSYLYSMTSCSDITPLPPDSTTFGCTNTGTYSDAPGAARSITPGYSNGVLPLYDPQWDYQSWTSGPYTGQPINVGTGVQYDIGKTTPLPLVPYLNASTVPQARINSLGNVLASCVEGGAAQCGDLFSAATPSGGTAPADTLQAALSIAQNPGSHGISPATLLALQPTSPPYSPALGSAPQDLTLALTFTGGGLGIPYKDANGPVVTVAGFDYGAGLAPDMQYFNSALTVDASGHIWVAGFAQAQGGGVNGDFDVLAEFDNLGVGLTAPTMITDTSYDSIPGGFDPEYAWDGESNNYMLGLAIDQSGMLWTVGYSGLSVPVDPNGGIIPASFTLARSWNFVPQTTARGTSIAVDGKGKAWYQAAEAYDSSGVVINRAMTGYGYASSAVFDSEGNLWGAGSDDYSSLGTVTPYGDLTANFDVFLADGTAGKIIYDAFAPNSTIPSTGPATGVQTTLVADGSGNVYGCGESGGTKLDAFTAAGGSSAGAYKTVWTLTSGRGCGNQLVLDGQGHIFALSRAQKLIDEFGTNGTLISPSSGYSGMGATVSGGGSEPPTLNYDTHSSSQLGSSGYDTRFGITAAIDGSGNLWVVNPDTGGTKSEANVLVEYVGIAAPVVTPTSVALTNHLSGARP